MTQFAFDEEEKARLRKSVESLNKIFRREIVNQHKTRWNVKAKQRIDQARDYARLNNCNLRDAYLALFPKSTSEAQ